MSETTRLRPWQGVVTLVAGGAASFGVQIVVMVVATIVIVGGGGAPDPTTILGNPWVVGPLLMLSGLGLVVPALIAPLLAKVPIRSALGFVGAPWPAFVAAPIGILALGPSSDGLRRVMERFLPSFTFGNLDAIDALVRSAPPWLIVPLVAFVPGFCEEVLFRGALQRSLRPPAIAIVASAILFAMIHADPHHVVAVIPLGFYLAWLGHRTQSTWVPIAAHVTNNGVAALAGIYLGDTEAETMPATELWLIPVGWVVAAAMIAVVWWSTRSPRDVHVEVRAADRAPEA